MPFHVTINGELTDVSHIDPDTPLLWALRDHLGLVGTKYGFAVTINGCSWMVTDLSTAGRAT